MPDRTKVRCPECGEEKISRGEKNFRCCGTTHKIAENKVEEQQSEKLDPQAALGNETDNMTEQNNETEEDDSTKEQNSQEEQQEEQQEEHDYNCGNCGYGLDRKLLKCPECGKRFNWGAA